MNAGFKIYSRTNPEDRFGYKQAYGQWESNNKCAKPHQGKQEIARRAKQIERGILVVL